MTVRELQDAIIKEKKERDICILVHAYQRHDIWEVADYIGDSFGLAQEAAKVSSKKVIMCGVRFMAETVKMLSPEKQVYLANPVAGCPMAEQIEPEMLAALKAENPDHTVVAYINTTAELKTLCDVAVTSSSAVKIINNIDNDKILFVPDCNLGDWIGKKLPNKQMKLVHGGCPTHLRFTQRDFDKAREEHPSAKILIHPESRPEFVAQADFVGSTTEIMAYAKKSEDKEFIIATENSIVEHLQFDCPEKNFYALSKDCVCHNMQATTLADVYRTVLGTGGEEILMSDELIRDSRKCIDAMLELGK